jgi:crotonobetainyl-CoA:carnitine CoA-transferase CaiB-like acyl-CoA transferase
MNTSYYGLEALLNGEDPPRYGNAHPAIVPYGVFEAADGPLVITVGTTRQFVSFYMHVIGRLDLAEDPRFSSNLSRSQNRHDLLPVIEAELAKRSRADLLIALSDNGIPCGEVLGLFEALNPGRARDAGMVSVHAHPTTGSVDLLAPPYRFDGERCAIRLRPPLLPALREPRGTGRQRGPYQRIMLLYACHVAWPNSGATKSSPKSRVA